MIEHNSSDSIIEIRDVVKCFPAGDAQVTVLKGISLQVERGEFLTIVGPSGNGKSTLLNMITGIDRPTSGEVRVTGQPIHKMSEDSLATWRGKQIGIIFQFFQMLPALSLLQNIVLPMELAELYASKERRQRAEYLLEVVGLADQASKLPCMVSGGQLQRAAIARALANDPALVVGDEPTGNLDSRNSEEIFDLFGRIADEGKTLVIVTHNKELVARVPRIVEIQDGKIVRDESIGHPTWAGH